MSRLSRKEKYQELRDQIDENTTASAISTMDFPRPYGNIDYTSAHAARPLHSFQQPGSTQKHELPKSEVMSDLLGEVKQYNIDNGTRLEDDTQINILRTLDSSTDQLKRTRHILVMEEEESSGSTMRISRAQRNRQESPAPVLKRTKADEAAPAAPSESQMEPAANQAPVSDDMDISAFVQEEEEVAVPALPAQKKKRSLFGLKSHREESQPEPAPLPAQPAEKEEPALPAAAPADPHDDGGLSILFDKPFDQDEKNARMAAAAAKDQEEELEQEEELHTKALSLQNIIIILLILLLLASISLTIFILFKSGIL